ncbi:MAG: hypothetical protein Q8P50_04735 [Bacillota bacterium]|nr:hypothetical protein [Bacillota bacterium]
MLTTQHYNCVMLPGFDDEGRLPPGIHWATWQDLCGRFGINEYRRTLLAGLKAALDSLKAAGCETVYLDGSFVTAREFPGDFDACWDPVGVDPSRLDPVLLTFDRGRATQKARFLGELFPATTRSGNPGPIYLEFFQVDKDTGGRKGIVALDLRRLS